MAWRRGGGLLALVLFASACLFDSEVTSGVAPTGASASSSGETSGGGEGGSPGAGGEGGAVSASGGGGGIEGIGGFGGAASSSTADASSSSSTGGGDGGSGGGGGGGGGCITQANLLPIFGVLVLVGTRKRRRRGRAA